MTPDGAPTTETWFSRHPLICYFVLCFGLSWGGILILLAATGFSLAPLQPLETGLIFALMLLGPSVAGVILTAVVNRRAGLRRLTSGLLSWKVGLRWYAAALLTAPLMLAAILLPLSAVAGPAFAPGFRWALLAIGLIAGSFEEVGWTGFATPRLLAVQSPGAAGLLLGLVWAGWHLLVDFRYNFHAMGTAWPLEFAIVYLATLTPYRMLMTWVYAHTRSVLLAILMHASFTGWLLVLFPAASLTQNLAWQAGFAVLLWLAVALVLRRPAIPAGEPKEGLRHG